MRGACGGPLFLNKRILYASPAKLSLTNRSNAYAFSTPLRLLCKEEEGKLIKAPQAPAVSPPYVLVGSHGCPHFSFRERGERRVGRSGRRGDVGLERQREPRNYSANNGKVNQERRPPSRARRHASAPTPFLFSIDLWARLAR